MSRPIPLYVNRNIPESERRAAAYGGAIFLYSAPAASTALVEWARLVAREGLQLDDPTVAHRKLAVEEFVRRAAPAKSRFTNDMKTRELCKELIV